MRLRAFFIVGSALIIGACANTAQKNERAALVGHPDWPKIRAVAVAEVLRQEGAVGWSAVAGSVHPEAVSPISRKEGVWLVAAAADYPQNKYGWIVEMEVSASGEVLRYSQLWKKKRSRTRRQSQRRGCAPPRLICNVRQSRLMKLLGWIAIAHVALCIALGAVFAARSETESHEVHAQPSPPATTSSGPTTDQRSSHVSYLPPSMETSSYVTTFRFPAALVLYFAGGLVVIGAFGFARLWPRPDEKPKA